MIYYTEIKKLKKKNKKKSKQSKAVKPKIKIKIKNDLQDTICALGLQKLLVLRRWRMLSTKIKEEILVEQIFC